MLNAVIFDFDGVIVDSETLHHKLLNEIFSPYNIHIPWEDYHHLYIGFDDENAIKTAFKANKKRINKKIVKELIDKKASLFEKAIVDYNFNIGNNE